MRIAEPEPVELGRERHVLDVVDLVGGDDHGHVGAAQQVGELLVAGAHAGAGVDDEHRDLGVGERGAGLLLDRARELVAVRRGRCRRCR